MICNALGYVLHRMSAYFTAGGAAEREKPRKRKGNSPAAEERQGEGRHGDKTGKRHRRTERRPTRRKQETVLCRVGSERSPCPVLMCSWRQEADVRWECDVKAATGWDFRDSKTAPPDCFSLTLYLCVVGRFACQVPLLSPTRTAIPERFFGLKIPCGNFLSRKPEARTWRYSPSELSSRGDLSSEAGLMMPFHGRVGKQMHGYMGKIRE